MKPTSIKLDRKRQFVYNLKALRELEIALGEPLFVVFEDEKKMTSIDVMCKFIWAGMKEHENLTLDEVMDLIPTHRLAEVMALCAKLLGASMSGSSENGEKKMQVTKVS